MNKIITLQDLKQTAINYRHPEGLPTNKDHETPYNPYFQMSDWEVAEQTKHWRLKDYIDFCTIFFETHGIEYTLLEKPGYNEPCMNYIYRGHSFDIYVGSYSMFGGISGSTFSVLEEDGRVEIHSYLGDGFEQQLWRSILTVNELLLDEIKEVEFVTDIGDATIGDDFYFLNRFSKRHLSRYVDKYDMQKYIANCHLDGLPNKLWTNSSEVLPSSSGAVFGVDWYWDVENEKFQGAHASREDVLYGITKYENTSLVMGKFLLFCENYLNTLNSNKGHFNIEVGNKHYRIQQNSGTLHNIRIIEKNKNDLDGIFGDFEIGFEHFEKEIESNMNEYRMSIRIINDELFEKETIETCIEDKKFQNAYKNIIKNTKFTEFQCYKKNEKEYFFLLAVDTFYKGAEHDVFNTIEWVFEEHMSDFKYEFIIDPTLINVNYNNHYVLFKMVSQDEMCPTLNSKFANVGFEGLIRTHFGEKKPTPFDLRYVVKRLNWNKCRNDKFEEVIPFEIKETETE